MPRVPLIAFVGLMHIRITVYLFVLRCDDCGINKGSPVELHTILGQVNIDQAKQLIPKTIPFHQMAKIAGGCFIRYGLITQVDTDELTHGT